MKAFKSLLLIAVVALICSCRDSDRDKDTSTNSCADYGAAQSYSLDVFKLIHEASMSSKGITAGNLANATNLFGCDTLIVDTVSNPMTLTIRFNGSCVAGGNRREGEITATYSGKYDNLSTQVNVSFNNYYYNDFPISGSQRYIFNGILSGKPTYGITHSNVELRDTANNRTMLFSGTQTLAIASGETTATFSDDTYSISGSASGRTFAGNDYSIQIDKDLSLKGNCNWVNAGTATVSPENKQPRDFDFGSSCDNKGTARIYGLVYEVEFPE